MTSFKTCPHCQKMWSSRDAFLADVAIQAVGYQPLFDDMMLGLFLFNHIDCGTTLAIRADALGDLVDHPVFEQPGSACSREREHRCLGGPLTPCPARCECRWVGAVLDAVGDGAHAVPRGGVRGAGE